MADKQKENSNMQVSTMKYLSHVMFFATFTSSLATALYGKDPLSAPYERALNLIFVGNDSDLGKIIGTAVAEKVDGVIRISLNGIRDGHVFVRDIEYRSFQEADGEQYTGYLRVLLELGLERDGMVEVKSGLFHGDEVVVDGAERLFEIQKRAPPLTLKEVLDLAHGHSHEKDVSEKKNSEDEAIENIGSNKDQEHHSCKDESDNKKRP